MEGISHEAIGLAGKQQLSRLIVMWDDNGISIDGKVSLADITDQKERFAAAGWSVHECDGHDPDDIDRALTEAKAARPAGDDRLPHPHRLRRADQAGHQGRPRLAARRRRDREGPRDLRLAVPAVRGAGRDRRRLAGERRPGAAARAAWEERLGKLSTPEAGRIRAGHGRRDATQAGALHRRVHARRSRRPRRRSPPASRRRWCSRW